MDTLEAVEFGEKMWHRTDEILQDRPSQLNVNYAVACSPKLWPLLNAALRGESEVLSLMAQLRVQASIPEHTISMMDSALQPLSDLVRALSLPRWHNEKTADHGRAKDVTEEVFGTPELLERILIYLPFPALLGTCSVNRTFHNTIRSSPRLQTRLNLRALAPSSGIRFSSAVTQSAYFATRSERMPHAGRKIQLWLEPLVDGSKFKPGSMVEQMLVAQPPLRNMQVRTSCCNGYQVSMNRTEGVVLRDIYLETARMRQVHRHCSDGKETDANKVDDGAVPPPRVSFEAVVLDRVPNTEDKAAVADDAEELDRLAGIHDARAILDGEVIRPSQISAITLPHCLKGVRRIEPGIIPPD